MGGIWGLTTSILYMDYSTDYGDYDDYTGILIMTIITIKGWVITVIYGDIWICRLYRLYHL